MNESSETATSPRPHDTAVDIETEERLHSGANWYYWLAALSIINSVMAFSGSEWGFMFGLGITQIIDGISTGIVEGMGETSTLVKIVGLVISVGIAGVFALFGFFANKFHMWAFIIGILLYFIDALLLLLFSDFLGLAFHAWVLFSLFLGAKACRDLNRSPSLKNSSPPAP